MARVTEDSLAAQIRALKAGQTLGRTARVSLVGKLEENPSETLQRLRNLVNQAVGRLRKEIPGSNFRVESSVGIVQNHTAALCTVAVTRFDGAAEEDEEVDI